MRILLVMLSLLPSMQAVADECSAFPGARFFGVNVQFRANQPQGAPIANAFTTAYRNGFAAVGFRLAGAANNDITVRGQVHTAISGGAGSGAVANRPAAGQPAPEQQWTCRTNYTARAIGADTAFVQATFAGRNTYTVADPDVAEHIRCAGLLGAAKGRADANELLRRLRARFAAQKNSIAVMVGGLPDSGKGHTVFEQMKRARCVHRIRQDQYSHGVLWATVKSGLTAERLLPKLRATVRNVRLTVGGSARINGRWTGGK